MFIPAYKKNTCLVLVIWLWAFARSPNSFEFFLLKRRRNRGKNDFVTGGDLEISIRWWGFSGWFRSGLFLFTRVGILWKRNSLNSKFPLKRETDKTKNWAIWQNFSVWMIKFQLPYASHYKPWLVYFLPHFSLRIIIKSGYY